MMDAERAQVPTAWLIRAGRRGEREEFALEAGVSGGGWDGLPDLTAVPSRHDLETMLRKLSPDWSNHTVGSYVGQLWMLRNHVGVGDLVVMPLRARANREPRFAPAACASQEHSRRNRCNANHQNNFLMICRTPSNPQVNAYLRALLRQLLGSLWGW